MTQPSSGYSVPLAQVSAAGFPIFNRSSTITVGPLSIKNIGSQSGLDVSFQIKSSLKSKEPNHCDLKVWNLSADSLMQLGMSAQPSTIVAAPPTGVPSANGQPVQIIPVRIDAGYVGHTSTIFLGELRSAQSVTDGPDIVTELNTGDGDVALQLQRISANFAQGSTPLAVVQALLTQMGTGQGNLAAVKSLFQNAQGALFQSGAVLKGNAATHLSDICSSVGVEFSIQGGQAQFLPLGQPLAGQAYLLSPGTGLVGTPTVDTAGICSCTSFILPGLVPGSPIQVSSVFVNGLFRIVSCEWVGETRGNSWYCKIEAQRFGLAP